MDCQPGKSPGAADERRHRPGRADLLDDPEDLVNNILRAPYRERLRLIITELGTGLAGPPGGPPGGAARAPTRACARPPRCCRSSATRTEVIKNFITDSDTVVARAREATSRTWSRWVDGGRRRPPRSPPPAATSCARSFQRCPTFLDELRPTMARLGDLTDEQTPLLRDLRARRARPRHLLHPPRPVRRGLAARPSARSARAARSARGRSTRASRRSTSCASSPANAPRFAKPLRQFLQTLDDRKRAIENDPRAQGDRPAGARPDGHLRRAAASPASRRSGTTSSGRRCSINGFDDVGHILRVASLTGRRPRRASQYHRTTKPTTRRCSTSATRTSARTSPASQRPTRSTTARTRPPRSARAQRRQAGDAGRRAPRRGPARGRPAARASRDISKPQIVLPPDVQHLLDALSRRQAARG